MLCGSWGIVGARDGELEGILVTTVISGRLSSSKEKVLGMVCGSWGIVGVRDEVLEGTKTLGCIGMWADLGGTSVTSAILGRILASKEKVPGMVCDVGVVE